MILYHYAEKKNLFSIAVRGLTPAKPGLLTGWRHVVWLTRQEDIKPTQADADDQRGIIGDEADDFAGGMLLHRDYRLTVDLSKTNKKLVHYHTWLIAQKAVGADASGKTITGRMIAENLPPSAKAQWWIYFGTIKPDRIDLLVTPETMLPEVEYNLASAVKEGDADRIERIVTVRDQIKLMPAGQTFSLQGIG